MDKVKLDKIVNEINNNSMKMFKISIKCDNFDENVVNTNGLFTEMRDHLFVGEVNATKVSKENLI